ncbi:MAG: EAL domain-containing protein [Scytolyngbya sp. HA4215-MV1]|nr:EAL domain-containing protein [Scytolyngbya sp. HA4215-MV1]
MSYRSECVVNLLLLLVLLIKPSKQTSVSNSFSSKISRQAFQVWRRFFQFRASADFPALLIASVVTTGSLLGVRQLGGLQPLELFAFDQMVRLQRNEGADPRLLIVAITETDIQRQKQWPLSDQVIAETLAKLQQYQPRLIGLDVFRNVPNQPGQAEIAKQLQRSNVIAVQYLGNTGVEQIAAPPGVPPDRIGFNDLVIDPDGTVRRNLMFTNINNTIAPSISTQLALTYLTKDCPIQPIQPKCQPVSSKLTQKKELQLGTVVFSRLKTNSGGYQAIDDRGYQLLLNYRSADWVAQQISLQQVLDGQFDPAWVKDKIVLIGTTAPSIKDVFYTPYSSTALGNRQMPGVMVHAQMVSQIVSAVLDNRPLPWFWSERKEIAWIWVWAFLGGLLAWRLRHPLMLGLMGSIALVGLAGIGFSLFLQAGWIPIIAPALTMIATGALTIVYRSLHDTLYDALTGLPNRKLFLRQLQWAITRHRWRPNGQTAVIFVDLDRFQVVNNSLGRQIGDQLLIKSVQRFKACLPYHQTIARMGGDEFALLLTDFEDLPAITEVADQMQQQMARPFRFNHQEVFTSISMGIVLLQPDHLPHAEEVLQNAQTAMHCAKTLGRARYEVFAAGMQDQIVQRLQLETDLRRAIEQREFQLYYQAIVDLSTNQIAGFEALIRWHHPERGMVSPLEFIPVAEETGMILPLGQWIFQEACRQIKTLQEQFPNHPPLMISINLSGKQFAQPNLVEFIEQTLAETELAGHCVKLEITESVAMHDVDNTIALLHRLKALDLQLSIDDFGTGYSSLSYLHRFPIDTLKVDRSFVSRMVEDNDHAAIVQTIVTLGHALKLDLVAEGIETIEQQAKLQTIHCEYGQGYLFSKPVDIDAAALLLEKAMKPPTVEYDETTWLN